MPWTSDGAARFLGQIMDHLRPWGLPWEDLRPDHLCYRVETKARYVAMKAELGNAGVLLGEHIISGRPIATFRLNRPVRSGTFAVEVVELPAPKHGSPYAEGFEHVEFVVPVELEVFMQRHPGLAWDTSGLHKAHHPELRLRLGPASVKFHRTALADRIAAEQQDQR